MVLYRYVTSRHVQYPPREAPMTKTSKSSVRGRARSEMSSCDVICVCDVISGGDVISVTVQRSRVTCPFLEGGVE